MSSHWQNAESLLPRDSGCPHQIPGPSKPKIAVGDVGWLAGGKLEPLSGPTKLLDGVPHYNDNATELSSLRLCPAEIPIGECHSVMHPIERMGKVDSDGVFREEGTFQDTPYQESEGLVLTHKIDEGCPQIGSEVVIDGVIDEPPLDGHPIVFLVDLESDTSIRWAQHCFIGAGSFGSVYLGLNLDSKTLMAVKEIKFKEAAGLTNICSYIRDELQVMKMLRHPNIVEYYGIEVHPNKVYIFEEFCQGGSLAALLEHGRIEDEGILQVYTLQMVEGLAYLHSQGVVHRDIKPDNILLDRKGVIKYVDFGTAKIVAKNRGALHHSAGRTPDPAPLAPICQCGVHNSLIGTPMYMSPEVIRNEECGRPGAMDIWSVGCVVLECATGRKPWLNFDNQWAIIFHIGVATQPPPLPGPEQLSAIGIDFIRQCLTIDPVQRPTTVELVNHPWMLDLREKLLSYEEATDRPPGGFFGGP